MWREGGPAQVPSNPRGVPAPPAHPRVAELTRSDRWSGPAGLAYLPSASGERPRQLPPELCKERALC